jgi:tryptophan 2,3-dioxygenase
LPPTEDAKQLTYGGYLKIRELLSLQQLLSDPPQHDETLFIIIHQVYELWFKQLLHEIDAIIGRLERDDVLGANRALRRCIEIQRVLVSQVAVLETMTPMDFLAFRDHLMPASGFQSSQFREIEFVSGLKDRRFLANYEPGSPEYARLEDRLGLPSLGEAFNRLLNRRGFGLVEGPESRDDRLHRMTRIYTDTERNYDLFLLAEGLIEYDETFSLWRLHHVQMVERMIGSKTGTGGSEGAAYLRKTADRKFFPDLWELRTFLSNRTEAAGDPTK